MKNKLKKIATIGAIAGSVAVGMNSEKITDTYEGKKSYIVVNDKPMIGTFSNNTEVKKELNYQNGFVIEATEEEVIRLKNTGAKVYENRRYSYQMGGKEPCVCDPCLDIGNPDPNPDPVPGNFTDDIPWGTERVQAAEALMVADPSDVLVCILDTGIDTDHEDLTTNLVGGKSFIQGNASYEDDEGHGTHVASTVAASINDKGIIGVSQAKIYAIKVLDSGGSGWGADIADGLHHAIQRGCKVINMSLGSPARFGPDPFIQAAVLDAANSGIKVVAAAGNDGLGVGFPAAIEHPNVVAVAAMNSNNQLTSFSSRGSQIDVIAPGANIRGAKMGGGYTNWDGTSMATPHVAAIWALALSRGKTDLVYEDLSLPKNHQGQGMPNALESVK